MMAISNKKFLVVREQGGGCDYTIGCGTVVDEFEAESLEALRDAFRAAVCGGDDDPDGVDDYGPFDTDDGPLTITIFEVVAEEKLDIEGWTHDREVRDADAAAAETVDAERAEYERLKKLFG